MRNQYGFIFLVSVIIFCFGVFPAAAQSRRPTRRIQQQTIILDKGEYDPASLNLTRGIPARLTVIRKSADECGEEIVFPAYGIHRHLPLNKPVFIHFTPKKRGSFEFMCGMKMMFGKLIVQ